MHPKGDEWARGPEGLSVGSQADTVSHEGWKTEMRECISLQLAEFSSDQRKDRIRGGGQGGVPDFPGWWETSIKSFEGRDTTLKAPDLEMGQLFLKKRFLVVQTGLELVM